MNRTHLTLATAAAIFLTVVAIDFLGLAGALFALGLTCILGVVAWAIFQGVAEAVHTFDTGLASLDETTETTDWLADMRAMKDTEAFDPKPALERERLRPLANGGIIRGPRLIVVENDAPEQVIPLPPADDSWLNELLAEDPLQVPQQRQPRSGS